MGNHKRLAVITAGMVLHVLAIAFPSIVRARLGLPWWPWLFVLGLPIEVVALVLLGYGFRRMRESGRGRPEDSPSR